jgi:hypothetical protein
MTSAIKQSIEEMERVLETCTLEFHPKARPFIITREERNVGFRVFDLAKLKFYYAALQLCISDVYSAKVIKTALEPPSTVVSQIIRDAWMALRTGTDQTAKITELLLKLFPPTSTSSLVKVNRLQESLYEEVKQTTSWKHLDYGIDACLECLGDSDATLEFYSCYVAILATTRLSDHEFVKASDEKSIF